MLSRSFTPFQRVDNFLGVNSKDTLENVLDGEWDENSINIFSDPKGAVGSRPGFSGLTTASIGTANAWCGFFHFRKHSGGSSTDSFIGAGANAKIYKFSSSAYQLLHSAVTGVTITADTRFRFNSLDNICVITYGGDPLKYTGTGSVATLGGTILSSDFGIEWQRYQFLHSTVDPRLMYYCTTLGSVESGYVSFLNFDDDPFEIVGASKQSDDMLIFKLWNIFRVKYTGSVPIFRKYRIDTKIGAVSHDTIKELPDGRVLFLAPDFNVYMAQGDAITPVGDNIKKILKAGVNSRIQYAVAGLLHDRSQYWLSFTYTAGGTTNDRTLVMDWSRPYQDKWGATQYPWFIYSIASNCFAEIYTGGRSYLYHGGYTGKMYKDNTGTNDDGSAFNNNYKSKAFSMGDNSLEKKFSKLLLSYDNKGSHNLNISLVCDQNSATQKLITQSMLGGVGYQTLWDIGKWDEDYWASETDADVGRDIDRVGKLIQITFGTSVIDTAWNILYYNILAKGLRRGTVRTRES
jgi:hypothetical protein